MGKIVKYCSPCDEGFAEKFGFCPNCGGTLQAFEMNPLDAAPVEAKPVEQPPVPEMIASNVPVEEPPVTEVFEAAPSNDIHETEEPVVIEPEPIVAPQPAAAAPVFTYSKPLDADTPRSMSEAHDRAVSDGEFFVTVIEEKNGKQRNALLLGVLALSVVFWSGMVVYSIFAKSLDVGSINDDIFSAVLVDEVPMPTDEEKQQKKDKDAGGGGGGGREEEETTKGDLANQSKNPQRPPQAIPRLENPSLVLPPASTQGNKTFEQKYDRFGDPNGRFTNWNNGTGTGGGQGSGTGTGQGSGRGTGAGSGTGSGYGGGYGNGNGNGTGDGDDGNAPPPVAVRVSSPLKIIAKPKAMYTDAARQNSFTGSVTLRITFTASGQISGISPIKGAPYGLTESAIAAARRIQFEPAKVNGVPVTVTKTFEYGFTLY